MKLNSLRVGKVGYTDALEITVSVVIGTNEEFEENDAAYLVDKIREASEHFGGMTSSQEGEEETGVQEDGEESSGSRSRGRGRGRGASGDKEKASGKTSRGSRRGRKTEVDDGEEDEAPQRGRGSRSRAKDGDDEAGTERSSRGRSGSRAKKDADAGGKAGRGGRTARAAKEKKEEPDELKISDVTKAASEAAAEITPALVMQILEEDYKVSDIKDLDKKDWKSFMAELAREIKAQAEENL